MSRPLQSCAWALVLAPGLWVLSVQAQIDLGAARVSGKNLAFPIHVPGEAKPVAVLRFGRLGIEHQRKSFFRIGAMPVLAGEDVSLEVRLPAYAGQALILSTNCFRPRDFSGAVEWRRFTLTVAGDSAPRLKARRVLWAQRGGLRLAGVTARVIGAPGLVEASSASLPLVGPLAGRLVPGPGLGPTMNQSARAGLNLDLNYP